MNLNDAIATFFVVAAAMIMVVGISYVIYLYIKLEKMPDPPKAPRRTVRNVTHPVHMVDEDVIRQFRTPGMTDYDIEGTILDMDDQEDRHG